MTPTLVFDIETVPDVAGLRRIHALPQSLSDADALDWALQQRRAATGNDFLPPYLQRVVAIACALREGAALRIASVGVAGDPARLQRVLEAADHVVHGLHGLGAQPVLLVDVRELLRLQRAVAGEPARRLRVGLVERGRARREVRRAVA